MDLRHAIPFVLAERPGTIEQIMYRLERAGVYRGKSSVKNRLTLLCKLGAIERVGRGRYRRKTPEVGP